MGCAFSAPGVKGEHNKAEINKTKEAAKELLPAAGVPEPVKPAVVNQDSKHSISGAVAPETRPVEPNALPDKEGPVDVVQPQPAPERNTATTECASNDAAVHDNKSNGPDASADAKFAACAACNCDSKTADTAATEEISLKQLNEVVDVITEPKDNVDSKATQLADSLATAVQAPIQESQQIVTPPPVNVAAQIQALEEKASSSPRPGSVPSSPRKFPASSKPDAGKPNASAASEYTPIELPTATIAKGVDQQVEHAASAVKEHIKHVTATEDVIEAEKPAAEQATVPVPSANGEADHFKAMPAALQTPMSGNKADTVVNTTIGGAHGVVEAADVTVINTQITDGVAPVAVQKVKDSSNVVDVATTHTASAVKAAFPTQVNGQVTDIAAKPVVHGPAKRISSNGGAKQSTAAVPETAAVVLPSSNSKTSLPSSNRSSSSGGSLKSGTNSKSNSGRQNVDPAVLATFLPPEPKPKDGKKSIKKSHSKKRK